MAVGSILLAILAFLCAGLGFFTSLIPGLMPALAAAFSFAAPACAIAGSIMGGVAMSRAKRENTPTDLARTGVILSAIAFVPALFIALFCGVCNALCATGEMRMHKQVRFGVDPTQQQAQGAAGSGALALPPPPRAGAGAPPPADTRPTDPGTPSGSAAPPSAPAGSAPPPAFPPPPLPAGPGAQPRSR